MSEQSATRGEEGLISSPNSLATQALADDKFDFDYGSAGDDETKAAASSENEPPIPAEVTHGVGSKAPSQVAGRYIQTFTRSLLFESQRSAYHDISRNCLQSWETAEAMVAFIPQGCRVTASFLQVSDEARELFSEQSRLLAVEAADHANRASLERGAFHIRQKKINNDAKKIRLVEYVAESLVRMANIFLTEIHGTLYSPHNLVADMLLIDHTVLTKYLVPLEELISVYKRVHKCGREPEDWQALYARRFPASAGRDPPSNSVSTAASTDNASATAVANANRVPPSASSKSDNSASKINRALNFTPSNNSKPAENADIPHAASNRETMALMLASFQRDSATAQSMIDSDPKMADLFKFGQSLIQKEGSLTSNIVARIAAIEPDTATVSTPVKEKPSKPPLASPQLIYNAYKKEYMFTRDDTPEEIAMWERCLNDALRKEKCRNDCIINSIRSGNFELQSDRAAQENLPKPPDGRTPPTFNGDDEDIQAKAAQYDQIPLVKLNETALTFKSHAFFLFSGAINIYLQQSSFNKTAQSISASESQYHKQKAGSEATGVVLKQPSQSAGPVLNEVVTTAARKESQKQVKQVEVTLDTLKRSYESIKKKFDNEKSKRKKLGKQLEQVKEHQAPVEGASQTNTPKEEGTPLSSLHHHQTHPKHKFSRKNHFRTAGAGRPIHHNRGNAHGGRSSGRMPHNQYHRTNDQVDDVPNGRGGRGRGGRGRDFRPPLKGRGEDLHSLGSITTGGAIISAAAKNAFGFVPQVNMTPFQNAASTNLLPLQQQLLDTLPSSEQHLFPETDKGLRPCCVRTEQYLEDAAVHLNNKDVYEVLSEEEALLLTDVIHTNIIDWLKEYKSNIGKDAYDFIHEHLHNNLAHPFGQFCILYKIHKGMKNDRWPTRPVCSDVSSLTHGLGKWVSEMLIPIQKAQPSYFQDSFALKLLLDALELPHNAQLFTADATSMYTFIKTGPALASIKKYIDEEVTSMSDDRKEACLHSTMLRHGNGHSTAPPYATIFYATIFYAIHEKVLLSKWSSRVMFYKRFIDDVIGVWLAHADPEVNKQLWEEFEADMNKWHDLEWTCETPSHSVIFMDMTITIVDNHVETKLYEKDMNLYLYLPPHSSHPRGVFTGLIFGQILRTRRLCTHSEDANSSINDFLERMLARGHTQESLAPLFTKAYENAKAFLIRTPAEREAIKKQKGKDAHNQLFLHLQFHPDDNPSTHEIQKLWQELVLQPKGEIPLPDMENADGVPVGVNKLIVAYSRPLNLKNRFSVRDIHGRGRSASEYLAE
eukprot:scaffold10615_cov40-Cyclotella_meneghiniana.AAC.1